MHGLSPVAADYIEQYRRRTGRAVSEAQWRFHLAFSLFRLAAISAGIYIGGMKGSATSDDALAFLTHPRAFGTPEQKRAWLDPLLTDDIRSYFAMTGPAVASSDATNVVAMIERDGDDYALSGLKWFTSGIGDPPCKVIVFMGKSDPGNPDVYRQQSMILVLRAAPGVRVTRMLDVFDSEPSIMLTGPEEVTRKVLARAGMTASDIDLFELSEAFASVVLLFQHLLDIDPDKLNVNGGAIAMGHPPGATGAMILGTMVDELERADLNTALVTLCAGAGMGTATIIERV